MKFNPQLMDFLLKIEQNCSSCVNANKVDEKEIAKASVRRSSLVGTQFKHTRHGEMAGAVVSISFRFAHLFYKICFASLHGPNVGLIKSQIISRRLCGKMNANLLKIDDFNLMEHLI